MQFKHVLGECYVTVYNLRLVGIFQKKKKKSEGPEADIWNEKLQLG